LYSQANEEVNYPTIAEINLHSFNENIQAIKKQINQKQTMLMAVVKTNAYGHGLVPISNKAIEAGVDRLGVTTWEEGALLRKSGVDVPIHLLSTILAENKRAVVAFDLIASVSSNRMAEALHMEAVKQNKKIRVHLKVDTGLHRFGIDPEEAVDFCQECYARSGLEWEGIYTHFSSADEGDWVTTERQFALFQATVDRLADNGFTFPIHHVGGSTIALERADMHLDMVRPGIALFGFHPANRQIKLVDLKAVMKLTSTIIQVRSFPPNTPVGYGGSYVTKRAETLAILPIGHGDGYKRGLSNKGEVLVNGKRAKIVGIISLDQMVINVTNIPHVQEGDKVVLFGKMGDDEITVAEVATWMDSIVDEVVTSLMERIPRKYSDHKLKE